MQTVEFAAVAPVGPGSSLLALPGAAAAVYLTGTTTLASLFKTDGVTSLPNPMTADTNGMVAFQAANGAYDIQISSGAYTAPLITQLPIVDTVALAGVVGAMNVVGLYGNSVAYATHTAMNADLAHAVGVLGVVYGDPGFNGTYVKVGSSGSGSWSLTDLLADTSVITALQASVSASLATLAAGSLRVGPAVDTGAGNGAWWVTRILDASGRMTEGVDSNGATWVAAGGSTLVQVGGAGAPTQPTYTQGSAGGAVTSGTINTSTGIATIGATAHGRTQGEAVVIAGCTPSAYNGTWPVVETTANTMSIFIGAGPTGPITANGTWASTGYQAVVDANVIHLTLVTGQSLSIGFTADTALIQTLNPWTASNAFGAWTLMLNPGPTPNGATATSIAAMVASANFAGHGDTVLPSFLEQKQRLYQAQFGGGKLMGGSIAGLGNQTYVQIKAGTPTYAELVRVANQWKALAATYGMTVVLDDVLICHGESDATVRTNPEAYQRFLRQWRHDIIRDIAVGVFGQSTAPEFLLYCNYLNGSTFGVPNTPAEGQQGMHDEAGWTVIGPAYWAYFGSATSTPVTFTATQAGHILTAGGTISGPITDGMALSGAGWSAGDAIVSQLSGTARGAGTYYVNNARTVSAGTTATGTPVSNADNDHPFNRGYLQLGEVFAAAAFRQEYGPAWPGPVNALPGQAWWQSPTEIRVRVFVPEPPIVIDTSGAIVGVGGGLAGTAGPSGTPFSGIVVTNAGAEFVDAGTDSGGPAQPYVQSCSIIDDGTGTATAASMIGYAIVSFVLNATAYRRAEPQLLIGMHTTGSGDIGSNQWPRTLIRDSSARVSQCGPGADGAPLYNWLVPRWLKLPPAPAA